MKSKHIGDISDPWWPWGPPPSTMSPTTGAGPKISFYCLQYFSGRKFVFLAILIRYFLQVWLLRCDQQFHQHHQPRGQWPRPEDSQLWQISQGDEGWKEHFGWQTFCRQMRKQTPRAPPRCLSALVCLGDPLEPWTCPAPGGEVLKKFLPPFILLG